MMMMMMMIVIEIFPMDWYRRNADGVYTQDYFNLRVAGV